MPKIRMFLWRAVSSALAAPDRLKSRGMAVNPICKLCQSGVETISHVLFECHTATQMRALSNIQPSGTGFSYSIEANIKIMLDLMENSTIPEDIRLVIPWVLWSIWKNQNSVIYANHQRDLLTLV